MALTINQAWYILIIFFFGIWVVLYYQDKKKSLKKGLICGFIVLFLAAIVELFGVANALWTYNPANWPWQLWICYFFIGMAGFQIYKLVDKRWRK